jgi:RNA polymerase sigma-70 factor (ECF subfamily)
MDFATVYEASRDGMARQVYALTQDWPGSCDLVQEAFVRCWSRWDRIATLDRPEAYVRRVAFNLAKSAWRRHRRLVLRAKPPEQVHVDPQRPDFGDLMASLARCSWGERQAITLHYLVGLSVEEIAGELSVPPGTVKSWLSRGRVHVARDLSNTLTTQVPHV